MSCLDLYELLMVHRRSPVSQSPVTQTAMSRPMSPGMLERYKIISYIHAMSAMKMMSHELCHESSSGRTIYHQMRIDMVSTSPTWSRVDAVDMDHPSGAIALRGRPGQILIHVIVRLYLVYPA